jgi:hypothetical protein
MGLFQFDSPEGSALALERLGVGVAEAVVADGVGMADGAGCSAVALGTGIRTVGAGVTTGGFAGAGF